MSGDEAVAGFDGTIFAYDCRMGLPQRALIALGKDREQFVILTF